MVKFESKKRSEMSQKHKQNKARRRKERIRQARTQVNKPMNGTIMTMPGRPKLVESLTDTSGSTDIGSASGSTGIGFKAEVEPARVEFFSESNEQ